MATRAGSKLLEYRRSKRLGEAERRVQLEHTLARLAAATRFGPLDTLQHSVAMQPQGCRGACQSALGVKHGKQRHALLAFARSVVGKAAKLTGDQRPRRDEVAAERVDHGDLGKAGDRRSTAAGKLDHAAGPQRLLVRFAEARRTIMRLAERN